MPARHTLIAILGGVFLTIASLGIAAKAQPPNLVQPWALPPLPTGVGPIEKFADVSNTPHGQFLEGGAFDTDGNLWFVAIGSGWISYLTPDAKLVPVFNCNPPPDLGQTCEPQGTRWHDGKLYLTTRHRGILVYDPQSKQVSTLVYTYRNQLFKGPNDLDFDDEGSKDPLHLTFGSVKAGTYMPGNGGPDGIHYDVRGNLWAALAGLGGIIEIDPRGLILGFVPIPNGDTATTNFAFGGPDNQYIYLEGATSGTFWRFKAPYPGLIGPNGVRLPAQQ